ncbi:MAG: flagellar protein FliS [Bacillota bacterium]|nr:flagellar protein FliS [Bacillota bacterium]
MPGGYPASHGSYGADRRRAYEQAEVLTASPAGLVAITLRVLEREVTAARLARDRQATDELRRHTEKAKEALQLLRQSLDFRQGGEIAARLEAIYSFLYERLVRAELRPASDALEGLADVISPLREAWERLDGKGAAPATAPVAVPVAPSGARPGAAAAEVRSAG